MNVQKTLICDNKITTLILPKAFSSVHSVEKISHVPELHRFLLGSQEHKLILKEVKMDEIIKLNPNQLAGPDDLPFKEKCRKTAFPIGSWKIILQYSRKLMISVRYIILKKSASPQYSRR